MHSVFKYFVYLISFAFARGALFLAPILLANLLPKSTYGILELSQATATLAASFVTFGTAATVPLIRLRANDLATTGAVIFHHLSIFLICIIALLITYFLFDNQRWQLTSILLAVLTLQSLWSLFLKTEGRGEASLLLDAGMFTILALISVCCFYLGLKQETFNALLSALLVYAFVLSGYSLKKFCQEHKMLTLRSYLDTIKLGLPLMFSAVVTIAITASGRLMIGFLGGTLMTADFAILARAGALPIIAHQVIMVAKFPHLYKLENKQMEQIILVICCVVLSSIIMFAAALPYFSWVLGPAYENASKNNSFSAILILGQAIIWSAISLNDTVNTREQKMRAVLPWCIGFLLLSFPICVSLIREIGLSLKSFVLCHSVLMLMFYLVQSIVMYISGVRLVRVWTFVSISFLALMLFEFLIDY